MGRRTALGILAVGAVAGATLLLGSKQDENAGELTPNALADHRVQQRSGAVGPTTADSHQQAASNSDETEIVVTGGRPHSVPTSMDVQLPDGSSLSVAILSRPESSYALPHRIADGLEEATAAAKVGNAEAAYAIFSALYSCAVVGYESESELEAAIATLYQTHTQPIGSSSRSIEFAPDADVLQLADQMRQEFEACEGLSPQEREAEKWLKMAADAGHVYAMYQLGSLHLYESMGRDYLTRAWHAGELEALIPLASAYAGPPGSEPSSADRVMAFSSMALYDVLSEAYAATTTIPDKNLAEVRARHLEAKARYRYELSLYEESLAVAKMNEMLRENSMCCFPSMAILVAY